MGVLIMVGQVILGLSILIVLHELGHFLAARAFGIKVEKFYLFIQKQFAALRSVFLKQQVSNLFRQCKEILRLISLSKMLSYKLI